MGPAEIKGDAAGEINATDWQAAAAPFAERILDILERKEERYAVKGNAWQNVFPTHIRDYQDWWARLQAA